MKRTLTLALACLALACLALAPAHAARADAQAEGLLRRAAAATRALTTLTADIELHSQTPGAPPHTSVGRIRLRHPNYARITLDGLPTETLASDGTTVFALDAAQKYTRAPADPQGKDLAEPWWGLPFRFFFTQSVNPFGPQPDPTATARCLGATMERGKKSQVVEVKGRSPMPYVETLTIGPDDLLYRAEVVFPAPGAGSATFGASLTRIKVNSALTVSGFRYRPPQTARVDPGYEARLIALGKSAPEFSLATPDGDPLSLGDVRRGAKATLLDFWYINCPPCLEELPQLQSIYTELAPQGLRFVAIDKGDTARVVQDFWRKKYPTLPVVLGGEATSGVFRDYGVEAFPVSVLLDASGSVVFRSVGFDSDGLHKALSKLGFTGIAH